MDRSTRLEISLGDVYGFAWKGGLDQRLVIKAVGPLFEGFALRASRHSISRLDFGEVHLSSQELIMDQLR
jgi:hypothetical protein